MSDGSQRPPDPRDPAPSGTLVRAYGAADLLMTGIWLYLRQFTFFVGISGVVALVVVIVNEVVVLLTVLGGLLTEALISTFPGGEGAIVTAGIPFTLLAIAIYWLSIAIGPVIAFVAVMIAMLQVCAGRRPSIRDAFAMLRNDGLRHLVTGLLPLLIMSSPLILLGLPFSYWLLVPVVIVLLLLPATLLVNALPSVVVEGATVSDPVMRSHALGRGSYVRNALVILVVVALQVGLTWGAFVLPALLPDIGAVANLVPAWWYFTVVGYVLLPLSPIAFGLLYVDMRVRKDAMTDAMLTSAINARG